MLTNLLMESRARLTIRSELKSSLKSIALIFFSLAGSGFLAFLTQVLLGRILTVEDFGILSTALSIVVIVTAVIGFGMPSVWLLIFGQEGWQAFRWVKKSFGFMLVWGPCVLGLSWCVIWFMNDARLFGTIWWLQAMVVMQVLVELLGAKLQLEARYTALSMWQLLPHLGRLSVAAVVYYAATPSVDLVAKGFCAMSLLLIASSAFALASFTPSKMRLAGHQSSSAYSENPSPASPSLKNLLTVAWPFAGAAVLGMLYGRIEIVLLGSVISPIAAGAFSIATAFLLVTFLVPQAMYQKFLLPKIHRWFYSDWKKFLSVYRFGCATMTLFGLAATIGIYWLGGALVNLFFGDKYSRSGEILSMLSVCILLRFMSTSIESSLMSGDHGRRRLYCQAVAALISVPCAYILIDLYGVNGAILNRILTELTLLVGYSYTASRYVLGANAWSGWSLRFHHG
ncbi:hypothetical protein W02_07000 [Nitrospira sp. KM1]|uniref:oligosaccharide flippase family protein n=1 Tax=Nitrospira sp. KM1 TaxID=1936990 RepID=UPI0013A718C4|nr:oligosaccharide flippase family protein [Nitrospira sp. KM1]BCA53560.1 hypothetical protein W02_07000 [Nitrospira sp. KM1]